MYIMHLFHNDILQSVNISYDFLEHEEEILDFF